jgi:hypothetical protein
MFYFWLCCFQEFHHLVDGNIELLVKLRDLIIDWVQEGFQEFFQKLDGHFHVLSGRSKTNSQESTMDLVQTDKIPTVLVLMLAQLCVYIEQTTVPKVTEVRCVVANTWPLSNVKLHNETIMASVTFLGVSFFFWRWCT